MSMISPIYAALGALLIIWLSLGVIKVRRANQISVGDGDNEELKTAMGAQSNAVEYIPIAILLLYGVESNGASAWLVHALGMALILGRVIHARALVSNDLKGRVLGMQITIYAIIALAAANVLYLPYGNLLGL
jgi:uncharacterized membrane protein YecN with MAPEG domain